MNRKHIITLSGKPGSGKSSTADRVAEMLGYLRYSSGEVVRGILRQKKMTLREYNAYAATNPEVDHEVDGHLRVFRDQDDLVVDARLGFYWIPDSFKVYLDLDDDLAVARIFKDASLNALRQGAGEGGDNMSDVMSQVTERMQSEQERFKAIYGVDPYDTSGFDLVIDTARHSPQTVALIIFDMYTKWLASPHWERVVASPSTL